MTLHLIVKRVLDSQVIFALSPQKTKNVFNNIVRKNIHGLGLFDFQTLF